MADISDLSKYQDDITIRTSILTDLTALKSAIDTMATKLNADAGVTDTNYAGAAALTTTV